MNVQQQQQLPPRPQLVSMVNGICESCGIPLPNEIKRKRTGQEAIVTWTAFDDNGHTSIENQTPPALHIAEKFATMDNVIVADKNEWRAHWRDGARFTTMITLTPTTTTTIEKPSVVTSVQDNPPHSALALRPSSAIVPYGYFKDLTQAKITPPAYSNHNAKPSDNQPITDFFQESIKKFEDTNTDDLYDNVHDWFDDDDYENTSNYRVNLRMYRRATRRKVRAS